MIRWVIGLLLWLSLGPIARAHDANLASFLVVPADQGWVLRASVVPHGADTALGTAEQPAAARKQALVDHVRGHVALVADGTPLSLGAGGIQLGDHQTDMFFALGGVPEPFERLDVHVSAFSANPHQTNLVRVMHPSGTQRVFLTAADGFRGTLDWAHGPAADASVGRLTRRFGGVLALVAILALAVGRLAPAPRPPARVL